jgi:hypothetical protein
MLSSISEVFQPVITKDGVSVARVVELEDDYEQAAVEVLRQAALETEKTSGDGTTTSTVLARAILTAAQKAYRCWRIFYRSSSEVLTLAVADDLSKDRPTCPSLYPARKISARRYSFS